MLTRVLAFISDKLYNNNTYSDLYKILFAQMCPSCKVMIERSEGCKFMECGKCQFQFCWLCLSEFYTEHHYYHSMCPMRIVPIYGVVALCFLFLTIKLGFSFPIFGYYMNYILSLLFVQLIAFGLTILAVTSVKLLHSAFKMRNVNK